jgi:hypothetical protein
MSNIVVKQEVVDDKRSEGEDKNKVEENDKPEGEDQNKVNENPEPYKPPTPEEMAMIQRAIEKAKNKAGKKETINLCSDDEDNIDEDEEEPIKEQRLNVPQLEEATRKRGTRDEDENDSDKRQRVTDADSLKVPQLKEQRLNVPQREEERLEEEPIEEELEVQQLDEDADRFIAENSNAGHIPTATFITNRLHNIPQAEVVRVVLSDEQKKLKVAEILGRLKQPLEWIQEISKQNYYSCPPLHGILAGMRRVEDLITSSEPIKGHSWVYVHGAIKQGYTEPDNLQPGYVWSDPLLVAAWKNRDRTEEDFKKILKKYVQGPKPPRTRKSKQQAQGSAVHPQLPAAASQMEDPFHDTEEEDDA